jgi:glycine cleavage system H protein
MQTNVPADLKYTKSHEWIRVANDLATVGITDHAQHELTDVVFVELPARGRAYQADASCAVVESVKTASDIYTPVSGEVVAVNEQLTGNPGLINTDPYGNGWLFQLKLTQPQELNSLLAPEQYTAQINPA